MSALRRRKRRRLLLPAPHLCSLRFGQGVLPMTSTIKTPALSRWRHAFSGGQKDDIIELPSGLHFHVDVHEQSSHAAKAAESTLLNPHQAQRKLSGVDDGKSGPEVRLFVVAEIAERIMSICLPARRSSWSCSCCRRRCTSGCLQGSCGARRSRRKQSCSSWRNRG